MISKFLNLEPEKRNRILNAALKEFAQKGYDDASTNEIVKEAGISKGLLFHYFNTKKELFLFLFDYSMDIIKKEYYNLIKADERDIFIRLRQAYLLKIDVIHKYPWLFEFSAVASNTDSIEVKAELEGRKQEMLSLGYEKMFVEIDESKFKDNIDVKKAENLIYWGIGGFANDVLEKVKSLTSEQPDYDGILAEFDAYLDLLRTSFYK